MSVYDRMDEEGKKAGMYLKMNPTDSKTVQVLTDPVEGMSEYQGKSRIEFKLEIVDLKSQEKLIWAIRQKNVMQQIVGIVRANRLTTLVGQKLQINTTGTDALRKAWFIQLLPQQLVQVPQQPMGMPQAPAAAPVTDPQGVAWLESQRAEVKGGA